MLRYQKAGLQGPAKQHRRARAAVGKLSLEPQQTGIRVLELCRLNTCVFRLSLGGVIPKFLRTL